MDRRRNTARAACVAALTLWSAACSGAPESDPPADSTAHEHDEAEPHDHGDEPRDPETVPCDVAHWRQLYPDLRACALAGEQLDGESLRRADLTDGDLAGASLMGADLFKAVLVRASLKAAALGHANLTSADLTSVDLTGASLEAAVLTNANLYSALLDGATTDETTTCPDGHAGPCW
jgi:hypothetical protein